MIRTAERTPDWIYHLAKIASNGTDPLPVDVCQCLALSDVESAEYIINRDMQPIYEHMGDLLPVGIVNNGTKQTISINYTDHIMYEDYPDEINPGKHFFSHISNTSIYLEDVTDNSAITYIIFCDVETDKYYAFHTRNMRMTI